MKFLQNKSKRFKIILAICVAVIVVTIITICIFGSFYRTTDSDALNDTELTKVFSSNDKVFLDGPGTTDVLVFYPGAFCMPESYCAPLKKISDAGVDVIISKPPLLFQLLKTDQILDYREKFDYPNWHIGGHSVGGVAAASFCSTSSHFCKKIIFVASYPADKITDKVDSALSLTASNDKIMNWDKYSSCMVNMPEDHTEFNIDGGNHAQFANYVSQPFDGEATISPEEQQSIAAQKAIEFLKK